VRIAALVKQIPKFESMALDAQGRLVRDGVELEMNAYCRRAVAKGVELAAASGGHITFVTLGPPSAEDVLREALAWAELHGATRADALHLCDPAFAGSDTLATSRALAAALTRLGPFDLVLCGRNSLDADTGQVGPQLAELLDLPFLTGVRRLEIVDGQIQAHCELDDGALDASVALPAVLSCAERLCDPSKVDPDGRAALDSAAITRCDAHALGPGPWGAAASPTSVGTVRAFTVERARRRAPGTTLAEQVGAIVAALRERGALDDGSQPAAESTLLRSGAASGPAVTVVLEPGRPRDNTELLGAAARLASRIGGHTVAFGTGGSALAELGRRGADHVVEHQTDIEADVAATLADWANEHSPWAIIAPSTVWGREVAARAAVQLGAGLTGDAVELEVRNDRLVAWKPAFGGAMLVAIECASAIQMATVRAGVVRAVDGHEFMPSVSDWPSVHRSRIRISARTRDDDLDVLADARTVIAVGAGVAPTDYRHLEVLRAALGAEMAATRKVTDNGWMPRARQLGITGRSIAPALLVSIGASGKFNHSVGFRRAATVLAINADPEAPVFDVADIGIVAPWADVVPALAAELNR
jgi:electron transfer flavoprotein alpha subunit